MDPLLKKLNYRGDGPPLIVDAPEWFVESVEHPVTSKGIQEIGIEEGIVFILVFIPDQASLQVAAPIITERLSGDPVVWFAYPKKSSKSLRSDIDRDHGWDPLESRGFSAVRQVSINEDWSALRFRHRDHIRGRA